MGRNDRPVTIQLSEETYARVIGVAAAHGHKVSPMIRLLVEEGLKRLEAEQPKRRRA